jgi:hypothetical protein
VKKKDDDASGPPRLDELTPQMKKKDDDASGPPRLDELTPQMKLVDALGASGFTLAVQSDIILSAIGRRVRTVADLTDEEADIARRALDGAVADRMQLEETHQ